MAEWKSGQIFAISGRTALIAGGAGGLGQICAKAFFGNGASVTIVDRDQSRIAKTRLELERIREELKVEGEIRTILGDLAQEAGIQSVIKQVRDTHTEIDILVHCAGVRRTNRHSFQPGSGVSELYKSMNSISYQDMVESFQINVLSQYFLTAGLVDFLGAAAQKGDGRGSVICFSSVASKHHGQFVPAYQTTKAAVDHLVKIMAAEFADLYIRVNAISPGMFPSNMNPADVNHPESNMRFAADMPARRAGYEHEMAGAALYLASSAGGFITGDNIHIDGGRLLVAAAKISPRL